MATVTMTGKEFYDLKARDERLTEVFTKMSNLGEIDIDWERKYNRLRIKHTPWFPEEVCELMTQRIGRMCAECEDVMQILVEDDEFCYSLQNGEFVHDCYRGDPGVLDLRKCAEFEEARKAMIEQRKLAEEIGKEEE